VSHSLKALEPFFTKPFADAAFLEAIRAGLPGAKLTETVTDVLTTPFYRLRLFLSAGRTHIA